MSQSESRSESANPLRRHVISSFFFQGLATFSTYLTSLALMPLVLKKAGAGVYGSFVLWSSLLNLGLSLLTLGAGFKARRALPALEQPEERQRVFISSASFQLLTYSLAGLVLIGMAPLLHSTLVRGDQEIETVVILAVVAALYLNTLSDDYFRYTHRIKIIAFISVLRSAGYPALVIIYVALGGALNANNLLLFQAISYGSLSMWLWYKISCEIRLRFRLEDWQYYIADIRFGFPLIAAALVENLLAVSDRYILGAYLSPVDVGVYASATAIGSLILIFPKVSSGILAPSMSGAADSGRRPEAEALLHKTLRVFLGLGLPFLAGAALLARPILTLLATPAIATAGRWVVPLAAVAALSYGWNYITFNALFVKRQTGLWLRANALAASLSISLNLVLLYFFRHIEVASLVAIASYTSSLILVHHSHTKDWPVRMDWPFLLRVIFGVAVMCAVLLCGSHALGTAYSALTIVLILVPAGALAYGLCLVSFGVIGKTEFAHIAGIFSK